jgi:hypothetical protein
MYRRLLVTSVLLAGGCATEMPNYDKAVAKAEALTDDATVKEWGENVGGPFIERNLDSIVSKCVKFVPESSSISARLVVDAKGSPPPTQVADVAPTPFSGCLRAEFQALAWPKAPRAIRFLPIEISGHNPGTAAERAADDFIISITSSKESLERTPRE